MHGFLGHDGIEPAAFRARAHDELARCPQVRSVARPAADAVPLPGGAGFRVVLDDTADATPADPVPAHDAPL